MNLVIANGRFRLGQVVSTQRVNGLIAEEQNFARFVAECLVRHTSGDWGDLCEADKRENEYSLGKYLRLFSSYNYRDKKIWIITEADRSVTTILFPDEY